MARRLTREQLENDRQSFSRELDQMHVALADAMNGTLTHAGRFTADGTKVFVWLCGALRADGGTLMVRTTTEDGKKQYRVTSLDRMTDQLRHADGSNDYVREMRNVCANAAILRNRMYSGSTCVQCKRTFTTENPCCCDDGNDGRGMHDGGRCKTCCAPNHVGTICPPHWERVG